MKDSAKKISNRCPDNSHFLGVFSGESGLKEKEILVDHILRCQKCRKKFDTMKELKSLEASAPGSLEFHLSKKEASELIRHAQSLSPQNPNGSVRTQGFRFRLPRPVAAGVLIVLASAVALYFALQPGSAVRSSNPFGLQLLSPKTEISIAPKIFKWTPIENAERYALKIIDEEMNTIWPPPGSEGKLANFEFELPESFRSQLVPHSTYIWTVEVYDDLNNFLTSESRTFIIK